MRHPLAFLPAASILVSAPVAAQTWVDARTTPALTEIVAVDKTGETGWLYGFEDLFGDGQEFKQQEQSIDIRTGYAAAGANRFWARSYVADPNAAGGNVVLFIFLDVDQATSTGGPAAAPEIHPLFTEDPTDGGYEYVIEVGGNSTLNAIWTWDEAAGAFASMTPPAEQAAAETGTDFDPIEINGGDHGYIQAMVDLGLVGLTPECNANVYLRSVHSSGGGSGDLDVGTVAPCVPSDENGDGIPDLVVPIEPCTVDEQCPGGGICVDGTCIIPQPCLHDDDCDDNEVCQGDLCVPIGGQPCEDDVDCDDLVCRDLVCRPCTPGSDECGVGRICADDGRCLADDEVPGGLPIPPGGQVQGGALTCEIAGSRDAFAPFALVLASLLLAARRERRQRAVEARRGA